MSFINGLVKGLVGAAIGAIASVFFLLIIEQLVFDVQNVAKYPPNQWLIKIVFIVGLVWGLFLFKAKWVHILALVGVLFIALIVLMVAGPPLFLEK